MQYYAHSHAKGPKVSKFQPGNSIGAAGRPKGSRNKLDSHAYACALAHVKHKRGDPAPEEYAQTSLWIALETTLKTQPRDYVRAIISMLPKEVQMDYTVSRLSEVDKLIQVFEEQIALAEEQEPTEYGPH